MAQLIRAVRVQAACLVLVMALLIGSGFAAARLIDASTSKLIAATTAARLRVVAVEAVLNSLQDAETGQRGFLLTGRERSLVPYHTGMAEIGRQLATLMERNRGIPWLEEEQAVLAEMARGKMQELRRSIEIARTEGQPAALQYEMTDAGQGFMEAARASAGRIAQRSERERAERAELLRGRQTLVTHLLLVTLTVSVLMLGAAALFILYSYAKLRRARRAEREQAALVAAAIEHVPDGVAVFGADGLLKLSNTRFGPTLGLPDALSRPGATIHAVAGATALEPPLIPTECPGTAERTEMRQDGRTIRLWRSPMPDGGQMISAADISRRVAAEEMARQAQKMDVLGQMTGGVAHDFNNLLQVVSANLELVRAGLMHSNESGSLLDRVEAAGAGVARGARLTRHLLAFARRQPLAPEPLDPVQLVAGMQDVLHRTLGETIRLELLADGDLWSMRADPTQFENALLNLALNARDAMTGRNGVPAGQLTIEIENVSIDDDGADSVTELEAGDYVMFAVTDTGVGMSAEQAARALEPFYTTKEEGRGTGLGLPMVLGFAKQSAGHFTLQSAPGRGTTARLYIPRTSAIVARHEVAEAAALKGGGEMILLVEDDEDVRSAAHDALIDLGYRVTEAEDADAAVALLEDGCVPHVVFTDVMMPGRTTARQLAARARALVPGIAVLFTSGYAENAIVHNGQLDNDVSLLSKPWRVEELARALRTVLAGNSPRPAPQPRVLLVEHDDMVRATLAEMLSDFGFDVQEACTAAAALGRLEPAPNLMVTGAELGTDDAAALVSIASRTNPGLPIVLMSDERRGEADVVWLQKPFNAAQLRVAIAAALETPPTVPAAE